LTFDDNIRGVGLTRIEMEMANGLRLVGARQPLINMLAAGQIDSGGVYFVTSRPQCIFPGCARSRCHGPGHKHVRALYAARRRMS
jgi:hypothetical protein